MLSTRCWTPDIDTKASILRLGPLNRNPVGMRPQLIAGPGRISPPAFLPLVFPVRFHRPIAQTPLLILFPSR
jgi:hypothetical protein